MMLTYTAKTIALTLRELPNAGKAPLGVQIYEGRAWPWLCDYQRHMNNARYLELMDYGRTQFFVRSGLLPAFMKGRISGVAAATQIVYRRSIEWMERYRLETQLVSWDDRWYIHEHRFRRANGEIAAHAFVRSMLRDAQGPVNIGTYLAAQGIDATPQPASDALKEFLSSSSKVARAL